MRGKGPIAYRAVPESVRLLVGSQSYAQLICFCRYRSRPHPPNPARTLPASSSNEPNMSQKFAPFIQYQTSTPSSSHHHNTTTTERRPSSPWSKPRPLERSRTHSSASSTYSYSSSSSSSSNMILSRANSAPTRKKSFKKALLPGKSRPSSPSSRPLGELYPILDISSNPLKEEYEGEEDGFIYTSFLEL